MEKGCCSLISGHVGVQTHYLVRNSAQTETLHVVFKLMQTSLINQLRSIEAIV